MKTEINNSKLYATIDSDGAQIRGLRDLHGTEYVWPGDDFYWNYSSPTLFPIVGAVRDNKYIYDGKEYSMQQHGFCRNAEFKKVDSRTDAVTYRFVSNEETRKQYPFDFELYISFELVDFSLAVKYKVVNCGDRAMPFCIGGHPALRIPLEKGEPITDYRVKFNQKETAECPMVEGKLINRNIRVPLLKDEDSFTLRHEMFDIDTLLFDQLKSRSVEVYSVETGRGVRMDFDGFDYFAIWQPFKEGVPFVCLEPWTGLPTLTDEGDELEKKCGMHILPAGETYEVQYKLTVI